MDAKRQESTGDEARGAGPLQKARSAPLQRGEISQLSASVDEDLFYTEGLEELLEARVKIAEWPPPHAVLVVLSPLLSALRSEVLGQSKPTAGADLRNRDHPRRSCLSRCFRLFVPK